SAGVSLLHSYYGKFEDIDDRNPRGPFENLKGKQLSNAPNYTLMLGTEYAWPVPDWSRIGPVSERLLGGSAISTFRLRAEFYHTDYILFRPFGHEDDKQKNYSIVNFFATL